MVEIYFSNWLIFVSTTMLSDTINSTVRKSWNENEKFFWVKSIKCDYFLLRVRAKKNREVWQSFSRLFWFIPRRPRTYQYFGHFRSVFYKKEFANGFYLNNKYLKYYCTRNCFMWEALMIAIAAVLNKLELILAVQFGFLAFRAKFE